LALGGGLGTKEVSVGIGEVTFGLLGRAAASTFEIEVFFFMKDGSFFIWTLDKGQFYKLKKD
jgi:hypothetical protein